MTETNIPVGDILSTVDNPLIEESLTLGLEAILEPTLGTIEQRICYMGYVYWSNPDIGVGNVGQDIGYIFIGMFNILSGHSRGEG